MSCIICTKKFGLFNREVGCPNCGVCYCSKCLKYTIPNLGKKKVCLSCYDKITPKTKITEEVVYKKTPEPLLDIEVPSMEDNDVDSEIATKLKSLKGEGSTANDVDIAMRLAKLRGTEYKDYSKNKTVHTVDNRSDQEKIDDLMKQYTEECDINEPNSSDIENRLALLKGEKTLSDVPKSVPALDYSDNEEDEETAKNIMKKYIAEAALDDDGLQPEEKEFLKSIEQPVTAETAELPWCTICNEDAILRCDGCDGDLFCRICFKEIHDDEEYRAHRTTAYKKPANIDY